MVVTCVPSNGFDPRRPREHAKAYQGIARGEALGEHGEETHGIFLYESTTAVPLVVRGPGILGGRRLETAVSLVDVAPTILEEGARSRSRPFPQLS